jgi:hypothetical protein
MLSDYVKNLARDWPFYDRLRNWEVKRRWPGEKAAWKKAGCPVPPPHLVKQGVLRECAKIYQLRVFVESGTCYGDMVEALKGEFDRLYSIELSPYLYGKCLMRFGKVKHITLIQGDSGVELKRVMEKLDQPALFYLDGHYSSGMSIKGDKETPICEEIRAILGAKRLDHVIVIDDARCFGVDPDYPPLEELERLIHSYRQDLRMTVENDCIRITPGNGWQG